MRNLTIALIAFAIAFSASAVVFHSVTAAARKVERSAAPASTAPVPRQDGRPAVRDDMLF